MLLSLLLAVASARDVAGPWTSGAYVTVAVHGQRVHAAWLEGDVLRHATSDDQGATWAPQRDVARGVEAGDGGQIRPELVVAATGPVLGFVRDGQPTLATLKGRRWQVRSVRSRAPGVGALMDVAVVGGRPVVVWLDTRRDPAAHVSEVWADVAGREELVFAGGDDGVCMCCRPVVADGGELPVVAFRDAEGTLREARRLTRDPAGVWSDPGPVTHGGWSPGGCPADGPVLLDDGRVLISDARSGERALWADDEVLVATPGSALLQPRAVGRHRVWVEAVGGEQRLIVDWNLAATSAGRLEPGDPVVVGEQLWVPWQGETAHVTLGPVQ